METEHVNNHDVSAAVGATVVTMVAEQSGCSRDWGKLQCDILLVFSTAFCLVLVM